MKFYGCKVRLAGNVLNEVPKMKISAPEVIILREIHGSDALVDLKEVLSKQVDNLAERERLSMAYGAGIVEKLFGGPHRNLPQAVFAVDEEDEGEGEDAPVVKRGPGRPPKAAQATA